MFDIQSEEIGNMLILHVTGDILLPVAISFEEEINKQVYAKKLPEVIIDLNQIGKMDNAALGILVTLSTLYSTQGRRLFLFHPAKHIEALIKEIGIEKFFPIFENYEELHNHRLSDSE
ncbi:MAG: STAS domain-containing protein [Desulfovibrio sp.]|nr:STAS domain-containing protein [Desulfovibrio sp.]